MIATKIVDIFTDRGRRGLVPKGIAIRRPGPAAGEKGYPAAPLIVHQQPSVARVWSEMTAAAKSQTRRIA
jgi:hypothetical protein